MCNQEQRIESLELQVLTLKVAVHKLIKFNHDIRSAMTESRYEDDILYSETNKMKSELFLDSGYIRLYASSCSQLVDDDILEYLD